MLGLRYASDAGRAVAAAVVRRLRVSAYRASIRLAAEKGYFPFFDRDAYLAGKFVSALPAAIRDQIAHQSIRNSHLLAVVPAGAISVLANNISSAIEPVFPFEGQWRIVNRAGKLESHSAVDYAYALWRATNSGKSRMPSHFVTAQQISPVAHLRMQAALQPLVDNSISKTINVPESIPSDEFTAIYRQAYGLGLKGCTVSRSNPVRGSILSNAVAEDIRCCPLER